MKTLIAALGCVLLTSGCVSPKIPDDVPPAPPARKGEPYAAPSVGGEQEGGEEGFGGGEGFGGDTPTMEVKESDLPAEPEEPAAEEEKEGEEKPEAKEDPKKPDAKKDGEKKKKPADGETKGKEPSAN